MKLINGELVASWRLRHDQMNCFVIAVVCLTLQDAVRASTFVGSFFENRVFDLNWGCHRYALRLLLARLGELHGALLFRERDGSH